MGLGCFVRCSPAKVSACAGSTLGLLDLQGVEKMGFRHVEMRVGFGGVLACRLGGLAGGLAGLVGVLPELAGERGVLALLHAVPHALPLGEGVERVGGQHGGEDVLGALVAALVNGDSDGGAAGGDLLGGVGGLHQLGELGGGEGVADGLEDDLVVSHGVFPFRPVRPLHGVVLFAVARM